MGNVKLHIRREINNQHRQHNAPSLSARGRPALQSRRDSLGQAIPSPSTAFDQARIQSKRPKQTKPNSSPNACLPVFSPTAQDGETSLSAGTSSFLSLPPASCGPCFKSVSVGCTVWLRLLLEGVGVCVARGRRRARGINTSYPGGLYGAAFVCPRLWCFGFILSLSEKNTTSYHDLHRGNKKHRVRSPEFPHSIHPISELTSGGCGNERPPFVSGSFENNIYLCPRQHGHVRANAVDTSRTHALPSGWLLKCFGSVQRN